MAGKSNGAADDMLSETDCFASRNTTWGELMFRLKAAEGKPRGPLFGSSDMAY
jgi:hypothetical protein